MLIAERFRAPALALVLFAGSLALPPAGPRGRRPQPSPALVRQPLAYEARVPVPHVPPAAAPLLAGHLSHRGVVHVRGSGLPADTAFVISIDPAWPHASVACTRERTRQVHTGRDGRFAVDLRATGECRFTCDDYRAYLEPSAGGDDLIRSDVFACR